MARNGSDATDVDSRIEAAGKAFGALRGCVLSSTHINMTAKRVVYEVLILAILLYGAESWSVTEEMLRRLRVFHARCVRAMCRVSRKHTCGSTTSRRRSSSGGWASTPSTSTSLAGSCVGLGMCGAWTTSACHAACSRHGWPARGHAVRRR